MRRIIHTAAVAAFLASSTLPALAQGPFAPVIYINNSAVTQFELDQRIRFLTLLRAPGTDRESALRELTNDRLKLEAARTLGIEVSDEGLEQGLSEFAGRANMDVESFARELANNGVEPQTWRDFVRSGIAWREVVRRRIVPTVTVSDAEIEQALKREIEAPIITQVLLSELIIPAPPGREAEALAAAQRLTETVTSEAQFAAAARDLSATPSAAAGGRLEWTPVDNLPPGLAQIILQMTPGTISQPLTVSGAVVLFFLRDTRGRLRAGAGGQTVEYLTMALPSAAEGARILAVADSCDNVHVEANRYAVDPISRQTQPLSAVPDDIAQRIASLDENEGTIIDYGAGARLLMLCNRLPSLVADQLTAGPAIPGLPAASSPTTAPAAAAPDAANAASDAAIAAGVAEPTEPPLTSPQETREVIFNRKINAAADAYLAELRADALIRVP